ncbi:MAG TPA: hypothetical protein VED41_14275 [Solirubrobacteraceae bacterium]|nr:hypothetical protein [Solirubrobacteraceae bacterium]
MSTVRVGLVAFAAVYLALALLMAFAPHAFHEDIGPYGGQNDHYLRDLATCYAAFAGALAVACWRESWRVPVLSCLALQSGLHAINHLVDIGAAHPYWLGPANFVSIALATIALAWLARAAKQPLEVQP